MLFSRRGYIFWVDFTNDNINRGVGFELAASSGSFVNLVTTGIVCAGN